MVKLKSSAAVLAVMVATGAPASAQSMSFESAAYVTCREAQAMSVDDRRALAVFLGEHSARHHGVKLPEGEKGGSLAMLVRGGCTLSPDSHLFGVIDRAILAVIDQLEPS